MNGPLWTPKLGQGRPARYWRVQQPPLLLKMGGGRQESNFRSIREILFQKAQLWMRRSSRNIGLGRTYFAQRTPQAAVKQSRREFAFVANCADNRREEGWVERIVNPGGYSDQEVKEGYAKLGTSPMGKGVLTRVPV
jgi:hypothetical protein